MIKTSCIKPRFTVTLYLVIVHVVSSLVQLTQAMSIYINIRTKSPVNAELCDLLEQSPSTKSFSSQKWGTRRFFENNDAVIKSGERGILFRPTTIAAPLNYTTEEHIAAFLKHHPVTCASSSPSVYYNSKWRRVHDAVSKSRLLVFAARHVQYYAPTKKCFISVKDASLHKLPLSLPSVPLPVIFLGPPVEWFNIEQTTYKEIEHRRRTATCTSLEQECHHVASVNNNFSRARRSDPRPNLSSLNFSPRPYFVPKPIQRTFVDTSSVVSAPPMDEVNPTLRISRGTLMASVWKYTCRNYFQISRRPRPHCFLRCWRFNWLSINSILNYEYPQAHTSVNQRFMQSNYFVDMYSKYADLQYMSFCFRSILFPRSMKNIKGNSQANLTRSVAHNFPRKSTFLAW